MSETIISVEGISKQYRLGQVGTGTFVHDLNRWWHRARGKEDPYAKVGDVNVRSEKGNSDLVWALKDISFDVQRGDVLGIIGKNGAGKSTLLKILSQVTTPTTGLIKTKGKIASLLEVGTGFHPELTGRENIFLNGAILGMTKADIKRQFDEIVEFSGVEKYIDTPVKRYSSGMYVRLAFAVAAHLEPEILIVDEVLAVGDAEFQRKCMGKMQDVSTQQGRTILFVSHNMKAMRNLCTRGILLANGGKSYEGNINDCADRYFLDMENSVRHILNNSLEDQIKKQPEDFCFFKSIQVLQNNKAIELIRSGSELKFKIIFENRIPTSGLRLFIDVFDAEEDLLIRSFHDELYSEIVPVEPGTYELEAIFPANIFPPKDLYFGIKLGVYNERVVQEIKFSLSTELTTPINAAYPGDPVRSKLLPLVKWSVTNYDQKSR